MEADEIDRLFSFCAGNKGTIKAWPDTLGGIIGQVQVTEHSMFCGDCPEIVPNPHINVETLVSLLLMMLYSFKYT